MSKRKRESSLSQIEKRIKEGRGQGYLKDYIPWLLIQDVPSSGRATRITGWKTNRIHHVHSDLERLYFYILEWSDVVTDIREQFPLLPIDETLSIAEELNIRHPTDPKSKQPIVMTTDFLISLGNREVARTIKPSSQLKIKAQPKRIKEIVNFFQDLYQVVLETDRVLESGGVQAWIVGHRTVLGKVNINLVGILQDWFGSLGYTKITTLERQYSFKRLPHHINSTVTRHDEIKTMMQEHILVVKKNGDI